MCNFWGEVTLLATDILSDQHKVVGLALFKIGEYIRGLHAYIQYTLITPLGVAVIEPVST
jgi:hypothetical protein